MYVDSDSITARWDRIAERNKIRAQFGRKTRRTLRKEGKR